MAHEAPPATRRRREDRLMNALPVQLRKQHVATAAYGCYRFHLRRLGSVIAVAGSAIRGRQIAANLERIPMHARAVIVELIGGDAILRHLLAVGMTARPGFGQTQRMHGRQRVFYRANIVDAVAVDAGGHGVIASSQPFAVDAGLVELKLVHPLLRPELPHEVRTAMTARTKLRYSLSRRLAHEAFGAIHGCAGIIGGPISAVAVHAGESAGGVHVILDEQRRTLRVAIQRRMTIHARVLTCSLTKQTHRREQKDDRQYSHFRYPKTVNVAR